MAKYEVSIGYDGVYTFTIKADCIEDAEDRAYTMLYRVLGGISNAHTIRIANLDTGEEGY